jgi:TolB protein
LSRLRSSNLGAFLEFSRDGKYLGLYTSASGQNEFWRIPMDGGSPEEMLHGKDRTAFRESFTWLRDARGIVSSEGGPSTHLQLWDLHAGTVHAVTAGASGDLFPAVSPDGHTLAYSTGSLGYDVIEVPLDGSAPRDVIATSRSEASPDWAPDGVRFAYSTDRSGAYELWLHNRQDGSERLIAGQKEFDGFANEILDSAFSPDGSRVAYRRSNLGSSEIWISPLSGGTPVRLWDDPARAQQTLPSWSPDGNWIAYRSTRDGRSAVLKARVGANARPELVAYAGLSFPVRWSPSGDWIAVNGTGGLRIVSPDGKRDRVVSQRQWLSYGWSKDGAYLYGVSHENRRLAVERVEISTLRETTVADLGPVPPDIEFSDFRGRGTYRGFSLHPDGKSFLTSMIRTKMDIWLLQEFDRSTRLLDLLWTQP